MKDYLIPACLAAAMVIGASLVTRTSAEAPPATQKKIANKVCPVGGSDVDPKGETYEYKGKTIGFCCDGCIADFKKDPEKYMKDLK